MIFTHCIPNRTVKTGFRVWKAWPGFRDIPPDEVV
jgi:hypothetical protein